MSLKEVLVPDIGNFESVDVIEVLVKAGDTIALDDSLITVESDKASMDIPAPFAGVVKEVKIKVGDKIAQGHLLLTLEVVETAAPEAAPILAPSPAPVKVVETPKTAIPEPSRPAPEPPKQVQPAHQPLPVGESVVVNGGKMSHASPSDSVMRFFEALPLTSAKFTPNSRANLRTDGLACDIFPPFTTTLSPTGKGWFVG